MKPLNKSKSRYELAQTFIDLDVLEHSREIIEDIYSEFDNNVFVAFSGGKDSACVLFLVSEIIKKPVNCFCIALEFSPPDICSNMELVLNDPRFNLLCISQPPAENKIMVMTNGVSREITSWDKNREHLRKKPDYIKEVPQGMEIQDFVANHFGMKGKYANLVGVRANESLVRMKNIFFSGSCRVVESRRQTKFKPIYHWKDKDVFKYLSTTDYGVELTKFYYKRLLAGYKTMRSSSIFAPSQLKEIRFYKDNYPEFYERIREVFPEIHLSAEYKGQMKKNSAMFFPEYIVKGWQGVIDFVYDNVSKDMRDDIFYILRKVRAIRNTAEPHVYPLTYIIRSCILDYNSHGQVSPALDQKTGNKILIDEQQNLKLWSVKQKSS